MCPKSRIFIAHLSGLEYLVMVGQLRGLDEKCRPSASTDCCGCSTLSRRPACPDFRLLEGHAAENSCCPRRSCIILNCSCWTSLFRARRRIGLGAAEPDSGIGGTGQSGLVQLHELETVEQVCSRMVILHHGKMVADDSIERLRMLMEFPTLERFFRSWRWNRIRKRFKTDRRSEFRREPIL